jgi:hypothetical protein
VREIGKFNHGISLEGLKLAFVHVSGKTKRMRYLTYLFSTFLHNEGDINIGLKNTQYPHSRKTIIFSWVHTCISRGVSRYEA